MIPSTLPDLSGAGRISLDIETYDPNLQRLGPGDRRRDGFICGIAVAVDDGPLIEERQVEIAPSGPWKPKRLEDGELWNECSGWLALAAVPKGKHEVSGSTPLEAACRAIVASVYGEEVGEE